MKSKFFVAIILFLSFLAFSGDTLNSEVLENEEFSFRGVTWGMTREQIKRVEILDLEDEDDSHLFYLHELLGEDVVLIYAFNRRDEVITMGYMFMDKYRDGEEYLFDLVELRDMLIEKYGEPYKVIKEVTTNLYDENDAEELLTALAIGEGRIECHWNIGGNTEITLCLKGKNFGYELIILYMELNLFDEELELDEQDEREETMQDL